MREREREIDGGVKVYKQWGIFRNILFHVKMWCEYRLECCATIVLHYHLICRQWPLFNIAVFLVFLCSYYYLYSTVPCGPVQLRLWGSSCGFYVFWRPDTQHRWAVYRPDRRAWVSRCADCSAPQTPLNLSSSSPVRMPHIGSLKPGYREDCLLICFSSCTLDIPEIASVSSIPADRLYRRCGYMTWPQDP